MIFSLRVVAALELVLRGFDSIAGAGRSSSHNRRMQRAQNRAYAYRSHRVPGPFKPELVARRVNQVLHQSYDRGRTGSPGIQGYPPRHFLDRGKVHVPRKAARTHPAKSDVDHAGPRLNHVSGYQPRTARVGPHAAHQQVGSATDLGQIAGMTMAPGNGGVAEPAAEDQRGRLAGNVASANNDRPRAIDGDLEEVQQREDSARCARNEATPLAAVEPAHTRRADRVDVLQGIERVK